MKICMIGDSHLAMMVNAQREQQIEDLDITPVSWPRQFYDQLSLQGTEFCAEGPELAAEWEKHGLPRRIDLSAFDKLVFVSYTINAFSAFAIMRDHVVSGWNDGAFLVKRLNSLSGGPGDRRLMTAAVFKACLADLIRENHTYQFVDHIRKHSDLPIVVVPAPYLAEDAPKQRLRLWGLKQVLRKNDGVALAQALQEAHEIAFAPFSGVTLLRQPEQTVVRGCLTKEEYREGARRFGTQAAQSADDIMHAGPLLGRLFLTEICKASPED